MASSSRDEPRGSALANIAISDSMIDEMLTHDWFDMSASGDQLVTDQIAKQLRGCTIPKGAEPGGGGGGGGGGRNKRGTVWGSTTSMDSVQSDLSVRTAWSPGLDSPGGGAATDVFAAAFEPKLQAGAAADRRGTVAKPEPGSNAGRAGSLDSAPPSPAAGAQPPAKRTVSQSPAPPQLQSAVQTAAAAFEKDLR